MQRVIEKLFTNTFPFVWQFSSGVIAFKHYILQITGSMKAMKLLVRIFCDGTVSLQLSTFTRPRSLIYLVGNFLTALLWFPNTPTLCENHRLLIVEYIGGRKRRDPISSLRLSSRNLQNDPYRCLILYTCA